MIDSRLSLKICANSGISRNMFKPMPKEMLMAVLPDTWIKQMAKRCGMIEPFADQRQRKGKISYGVSSYGYDFRLFNEFKIPDFGGRAVMDPKRMDAIGFTDFHGQTCRIPPNSFILGRSLEYFRIPRDVIVTCQGKSTYARCGVIINVTPLEPEWEGHVTLEFSNTTPLPAKIYANEGVAQMLFFGGDEICETSYKDRGGKYQGQVGVTLPKA